MNVSLALRSLSSCALLLALTSTAQAADNEERQARILYQKGNAAFKKGDSILARDYYKKSLALHESFDTVCNLGRAQAQDKLYVEAYESLVWCAHLYPEDEELAEARIKFIRLRDEVRTEIGPLDQKEVDERVAEEIARREAEPELPPPDVSPALEEEPEPAPATELKRSKAALPVSLTIGGLGLAGLGVGTGFLIDGIMKKDDVEGLSEELDGVDCLTSDDARCVELKELADKKDRSSNIATASFIAGGVLVAGAVLTYALWPKTRKVSVAGLVLYQPVPSIDYDCKTGTWQAGFSAQF